MRNGKFTMITVRDSENGETETETYKPHPRLEFLVEEVMDMADNSVIPPDELIEVMGALLACIAVDSRIKLEPIQDMLEDKYKDAKARARYKTVIVDGKKVIIDTQMTMGEC